jgi:Domain of unknown function (DUF4349)
MSASETFPSDLVAELRALPISAPPHLRERVRGLCQPTPRRALTEAISLRRTLVVLVPVCALALVAAAVVHGVLSSSKSHAESAAATAGPARAHAGVVTGNSPLEPAPPQRSLVLPAPSPTRHQNYQADLRVRVKNYDALGRETAAAMRITTELGGFVASVQQSSAKGTPGEADLVLRVPVANVEQAMIRMSALGTVLDQRVSIVDLEQTVRQQRDRIRALRVRIAKIDAALRQSLPPDVRLRLQFQLDDARRALARATGDQKTTLRAAALSRIALTLTTQHAASATTHHRGRFGSAVANAGDFLAAAGAVALLVLIVVSPLLLLALLWWYGARAWRRREERRLLMET